MSTLVKFSRRLAHHVPASSTSRDIFRGSVANKVGLSQRLDALLRNSHDMRLFGVGFLAEVGGQRSYARALAARYHYYAAMEARFDAAAPASAIGQVWPRFEAELRRTDRLAADLRALGTEPALAPRTAALDAYVAAIGAASANGLLGHFYCRYFADLFGGSMLGTPTRLALGLADECAAYRFPPRVEADRRAYVESVYVAINDAGEALSEPQRAEVVEEARGAFAHNGELVKERGLPVLGQAVAGVANLVLGYGRRWMLHAAPLGEIGGRIVKRRL
jgi:heme oxygenase